MFPVVFFLAIGFGILILVSENPFPWLPQQPHDIHCLS